MLNFDTPAKVRSVFHVIDSWKCINDQRQDSLNILVVAHIKFVIGEFVMALSMSLGHLGMERYNFSKSCSTPKFIFPDLSPILLHPGGGAPTHCSLQPRAPMDYCMTLLERTFISNTQKIRKGRDVYSGKFQDNSDS